ncbi:M23 family peptidase [bacterium]|nr:M23 family peptidase [bacterium]
MPRPLRAALTLVLLATLAPPRARALAIDCPEAVPEGTAFVLTLRTALDTDSLHVEWLGATLRPPLATTAKARVARLVLGLGMRERLAGDRHTLRVREWRSGAEMLMVREIRREPRAYPEQHLTVESKYSQLSPADSARAERERLRVRETLARVSPAADWPLPLGRPVAGEPSSDFGLRRFFNGEAKSPHSGLDLKAADGTPVAACADGQVTLAEEHFYAGNSVYLDHGDGLFTLYFHLSDIAVQPGQRVARGEIIARTGATGRVTGPHLHLGVSAQGQLVDPELLLAPAEAAKP